MPTAPQKLCQCGLVTKDGRCEKCGPSRKGHAKSATERKYDGPWKRLSKKLRTEQPFCIACWNEGRVTIAEPGKPLHGHHITKVCHAPELRLERSNVLVVCEDCHASLDTLYEYQRSEYVKLAGTLMRTRDALLGRQDFNHPGVGKIVARTSTSTI